VQGITSQIGRSGVTGLNGGGGNGVFGQSKTGRGVAGISDGGIGVFGESNGGDGVHGHSKARDGSGVTAFNEGGGRGLTAVGSPAGHFDGNVEVTGSVTAGDFILANADCAEDFDVSGTEEIEPGSADLSLAVRRTLPPLEISSIWVPYYST
jgi:hypothetical protein